MHALRNNIRVNSHFNLKNVYFRKLSNRKKEIFILKHTFENCRKRKGYLTPFEVLRSLHFYYNSQTPASHNSRYISLALDLSTIVSSHIYRVFQVLFYHENFQFTSRCTQVASYPSFISIVDFGIKGKFESYSLARRFTILSF